MVRRHAFLPHSYVFSPTFASSTLETKNCYVRAIHHNTREDRKCSTLRFVTLITKDQIEILFLTGEDAFAICDLQKRPTKNRLVYNCLIRWLWRSNVANPKCPNIWVESRNVSRAPNANTYKEPATRPSKASIENQKNKRKSDRVEWFEILRRTLHTDIAETILGRGVCTAGWTVFGAKKRDRAVL